MQKTFEKIRNQPEEGHEINKRSAETHVTIIQVKSERLLITSTR